MPLAFVRKRLEVVSGLVEVLGHPSPMHLEIIDGHGEAVVIAVPP